MKVNVLKFLEDAGIEEKIYPGKRLVKQCPQAGEYKSHSVVVDWRDPGTVRLDIRAGLSGKDLDPKIKKKYPVSFQAPTFVEIDVQDQTDDEDDEDEEESSASGKGGGGKKPAKNKKPDMENIAVMAKAFSNVTEGAVQTAGKIKQMVVMGMEIGERAYERVMEVLTSQIRQGRVHATDLLAEGGKFITRYTPPAFMKPTGNETAVYKYDRTKNEPMFGASGPK